MNRIAHCFKVAIIKISIIKTSIFIVAYIGLLQACAPRQAAEVVERKVLTEREQDESIGGQFIRIANPGDTLYSIAFEAGLDVNKIAAWNGIQDTSKLLAGQRIRLTEPIGFVYPKKAKPKTGIKPNKPTDVSRNLEKSVNKSLNKSTNTATIAKSSPKRELNKQLPRQPKSEQSKPHNPVKPSFRVVEPGQNDDTPMVVNNEGRLNQQKIIWQWPMRGSIVQRFSPAKGHKGIEVQGQKGQPIRASALGEVVYAGNSLKGYGNLVIIKHSESYLSAYANNQTILVKEGQFVKQGQMIAMLGKNGSGRYVSQFQIRKNGNPVDPMRHLP